MSSCSCCEGKCRLGGCGCCLYDGLVMGRSRESKDTMPCCTLSRHRYVSHLKQGNRRLRVPEILHDRAVLHIMLIGLRSLHQCLRAGSEIWFACTQTQVAKIYEL